MKRHYHILIALAALLPFATSCANAANTSDNKPTELVTKAYDKQELTFEVTYVQPTGSQSFFSSDGYTLVLKDGKAKAHLPFIGEAHQAVFAGIDSAGIDFNDCPVKIKSSRNKDKYVLKFTAKSGNESFDVTLNIWPDGSAELVCIGSSRSVMRYNGELK